jgi:hypothetical protein
VLSRWLGWLSGAGFVALGCAEVSWPLRAGLWAFGAALVAYWVLERIEGRRGARLMRCRVALMVPLYLGAILCSVGGVRWLLGW